MIADVVISNSEVSMLSELLEQFFMCIIIIPFASCLHEH